MKPQP